MPRTAPAVDGTPDFARVSMTFTDYTGDQRSVSLLIPAATTDANIEAMADAIGDVTHANLWRVEKTFVYEGDSSKSNAQDDGRSSVYDNVVILFRNATTRQTQDAFIPAPYESLFIADTDNPDTDPASVLSVLTGVIEVVIGAAAYNPISARFTERREINQRQKY